MTKRDRDFLIYLVELGEKANAEGSDECILSFEKDGVGFRCKMNFETYEISEVK